MGGFVWDARGSKNRLEDALPSRAAQLQPVADFVDPSVTWWWKRAGHISVLLRPRIRDAGRSKVSP